MEDIFQVLADNDGCRPLLQQRMGPMAVDILTSSETQVPLGLVAVREPCDHIPILLLLFFFLYKFFIVFLSFIS